jgi:hypothetical protein
MEDILYSTSTFFSFFFSVVLALGSAVVYTMVVVGRVGVSKAGAGTLSVFLCLGAGNNGTA